MAFSGDNRAFGIIHGDGELHVWPVDSTAPKEEAALVRLAIGETNDPALLPIQLSAGFSPKGTNVLTMRGDTDNWDRRIVSAYGRRDATSGKVLTQAGALGFGPDLVHEGGFSADGSVRWVVGNNNGSPLISDSLWVVSLTQKFIKWGRVEGVAALSPSGTRFAWGETNRVVWVHLDGTNPELQPVPLTEAGFAAKALAFSPDGSLLAAGGPTGQLAVWNVASGGVQVSANVSAGDLMVLKFSADGTRLLCGDSRGTLSVFDLAMRQVMNRIAASTHSLTRMALDPDEPVLVLADADNEVTQWSLPAGRRLAGERFFGSPITELDVSPDGGRLLVAQLRTELSVVKLSPVVLRAGLVDGELELEWAGGTAPFRIQHRSQAEAGDWTDVGKEFTGRSARMPASDLSGFARIISSD